jgi:UPF0176 protein
MEWLKSDPVFQGTDFDFKIEKHDAHTFAKLHVRVKNEIVHSDLPVNPLIRTGKHVKPAEFKDMIKNDPDVVLVDMRSNYEHELGRFQRRLYVRYGKPARSPRPCASNRAFEGQKSDYLLHGRN